MNVCRLSFRSVWPEDEVFELKSHNTCSIARMVGDEEEAPCHVSLDALRFQFACSPEWHTRSFQPSSRFLEDIRHFGCILMRCLAD
jgi:hypothetical protein